MPSLKETISNLPLRYIQKLQHLQMWQLLPHIANLRFFNQKYTVMYLTGTKWNESNCFSIFNLLVLHYFVTVSLCHRCFQLIVPFARLNVISQIYANKYKQSLLYSNNLATMATEIGARDTQMWFGFPERKSFFPVHNPRVQLCFGPLHLQFWGHHDDVAPQTPGKGYQNLKEFALSQQKQFLSYFHRENTVQKPWSSLHCVQLELHIHSVFSYILE